MTAASGAAFREADPDAERVPWAPGRGRARGVMGEKVALDVRLDAAVRDLRQKVSCSCGVSVPVNSPTAFQAKIHGFTGVAVSVQSAGDATSHIVMVVLPAKVAALPALRLMRSVAEAVLSPRLSTKNEEVLERALLV